MYCTYLNYYCKRTQLEPSGYLHMQLLWLLEKDLNRLIKQNRIIYITNTTFEDGFLLFLRVDIDGDGWISYKSETLIILSTFQ